ncbi:MAG TPA: universal stress protein [Anaerolineae bacterium]|nr:universal stress protein [Anaerolineae bacterium]
MFEKILVPLDGSDLAENALPRALWLAQQTEGKLILLHIPAAQGSYYTGMEGLAMHNVYAQDVSRESQYAAGQEYLNNIRYGLGRNYPDLQWEVRVESGDPASVIVDMAQEEGVDLIVMSTHGRSGISRWLLGSVTEKVLCQAPCPVLSVRSQETIEKVLVTLDGSELSETCLPAAFSLAAAFDASVTLLRVYSDKDAPDFHQVHELNAYEAGLGARMARDVAERAAAYLENIRLQYEAVGVPVTTAVRYGSPAPVILEFSEEFGLDLIVMSTHGRTGLRRWAFGSVTAKVLRSTNSDMLTIRPTAVEFKKGQEGFKWVK